MISYSERRQRAYFSAAVEMYRVATDALNDYAGAEMFTERDAEYVRSVSQVSMQKGRALEDLGHAERIADGRQNARLQRVKDKHSDAVTRFLNRRVEVTGAI